MYGEMSAPEHDAANPGEISVLMGTTNWLPDASNPFSTALAGSDVKLIDTVIKSAKAIRKDLIGEDYSTRMSD
jgi:hypothetical protein